ncbi:uroporphyrinogen decarboxylase family protein [Thermodesulfobacteriota bacterium]
MPRKIPFSEEELKVVGEIPSFFPGTPGTPVYNFPVPPREAFIGSINKEPIWQVTHIESTMFCPNMYPDNVARGFMIEASPLPREEFGGKDMFGIEWQYVDTAQGSMVKPGKPFLKDANEWEEKLVWPDINSWDWEGSAKSNREYLSSGKAIMPWIMNGYYERLISFMDFDNAVMALIDEDQQDAVKALFNKLTDLYIQIVDKFIEYFNADGITVHDDWGSQRAPFFSPGTSREMIVPAMGRLTDHIHERGKIADFHSCGHLEMQVPAIIEAGWDIWTPQAMNDTHMLYEKYGDQIVLGVIPEKYPPGAGEEQQRAEAAKFVEKFCNPEKPAHLSFYGMPFVTPAYREELYKLSRIKFAG